MTHPPVALVTGSSRGIGLAAARALAQRGFRVALNGPALDQELEQSVASLALMTKAVAVAGDVADLAAHAAMLDTVESQLGPLSTLVNNAGVSVLARGDVLDVSPESYDRCMSVNARAVFFLSQTFARRLLLRTRDDDRFYSLINVTSSNARSVALNRGEYCASKSAAAMISQVFAARLGAENICVYDVQPGVIETAMTAAAVDDYRRRIEREGLTLLPRIGTPDDVGRIIATLACGDLPYTTGQVIAADAGLLVSRF